MTADNEAGVLTISVEELGGVINESEESGTPPLPVDGATVSALPDVDSDTGVEAGLL